MKAQVIISGYGSDVHSDVEAVTELIDFDTVAWVKENLTHETRQGLDMLKIGHRVDNIVTTDGEVTSLGLPIGVTVVFGKSGTGKSHLMEFLANKLGFDIVRFSEPEIPCYLNPNSVIKEIEEFLEDKTRTIFGMDSFRFWVFNSKKRGAAAKGGINTSIYSDLTALSVVASMLNKTILVVLNPMSDDDSVLSTVTQALEGSVSGVIRTRAYGEFSFVARTEENNRKMETYVVDFEVSSTTKARKDSEVKIEFKQDLSIEDRWARITRN
jgi:hypothetical protein